MLKKPNNYELIWETVKQIPKGKVASYGDIATLSGLIGQQRLVGYALHNLPRNSGVPWQRVINSQGKISLSKNTGSYARQKKLLKQEGIIFEKEKIDLEKFGIMQSLEKERL
jgi:methylated-DNA-protein-cysteine methyltransferase-like protein